MLQQVAVVARDLDHPRGGTQTEPACHLVAVAPRVLDPAVRVRRKVCVVGEDLLRRYVFLELHEEALGAHPGMQWVEPLQLVELLRLHMRLARRRHSEVDKRRLERSPTESATRSRPEGSRNSRFVRFTSIHWLTCPLRSCGSTVLQRSGRRGKSQIKLRRRPAT